jgi:SAM-dependent methyltransferase
VSRAGAEVARVADRLYQNAGNPPLLALVPTTPGRALDCGCGAGDNARILRSRGWTVTGITASSAEQQVAAEHCDRVFLADLEDPLPAEIGGPFDLVILSHVLEHLVHPEALLHALQALLSPNGVLAVALPNVLFYPQRFKALRGRFEYERDGIMDETHLRFFTFASGRELLRRSGFRVLSAGAAGGVPLWKLRRLLPQSWIDRVNRVACRSWPGLFGRQCLYLACLEEASAPRAAPAPARSQQSSATPAAE